MADPTVNRLTHGLTLDDTDALHAASAKLVALLNHAYGESGEPFRNMNDDAQDTYLWACADLAREVAKLAKGMASINRGAT